MDEFPRRAFCALFAASAGTVAGCSSMARDSPGEGERGTAAEDDGLTVVSTRRQLEAAFDDLSPGDTVRISDENAPYRTTGWLDVDVDGVTVVGPGVRDLIVPAEGASVGGIRVGHHSACREIDVRGVGFRGTPAGGANASERLHGIAVRNATNVTVERNQVRRTLPVQHGDGGSGISVGRKCSDVRIANNQVHEFGDRGIQLGGRRVVVFGNVVTDGLDRPVACDLWHPDEKNRTARSVSVFGNLLGDSVQGSLVGIGRNTPLDANGGYVSIYGNVGFGSHKSFCHVRGPNALRNISIQNNVSRQTTDRLRTDQTTEFAGVSVDVQTGGHLSIKNNELYDYSGHGVHVNSRMSDVTVQQNGVYDAGRSGIRVADAADGLVSGNLITRTGRVGIRFERTSNLVARGNFVRRAGNAGIVSGGADASTGNDIVDNYVVANGETDDPSAGRPNASPGILVADDGVRVRGNVVRRPEGPAIAEPASTAGNLYESNWADGDRPWRFRSPSSRVRGNTPPTGVHADRRPPGRDDGPRKRRRPRRVRPGVRPPTPTHLRPGSGRRPGGVLRDGRRRRLRGGRDDRRRRRADHRRVRRRPVSEMQLHTRTRL